MEIQSTLMNTKLTSPCNINLKPEAAKTLPIQTHQTRNPKKSSGSCPGFWGRGLTCTLLGNYHPGFYIATPKKV